MHRTAPATATPTIEPVAALAASAGTAAGEFLERVYTDEAGSRAYRLYVPSVHGGSTALPLLVMLHGCAQDAADLAAGTRMNRLAEEQRFFVVYPEQPAGANPQRCWNWFLPQHRRREGGEAALIAGITREVMRTHQVDARRVYVAGISAGGAMAVVMAASHPELFAAAASHSGVMFGAASDVPQALAALQARALDPEAAAAAASEAMGDSLRPLPLLVFHGAADPIVSPDNAVALADQWARLQRLAGAPLRQPEIETAPHDGRQVTRWVYRDAAGRVLLERWSVEGLAHAWSGGDAAGSFADPAGPDASREIARFFLARTAR